MTRPSMHKWIARLDYPGLIEGPCVAAIARTRVLAGNPAEAAGSIYYVAFGERLTDNESLKRLVSLGYWLTECCTSDHLCAECAADAQDAADHEREMQESNVRDGIADDDRYEADADRRESEGTR